MIVNCYSHLYFIKRKPIWTDNRRFPIVTSFITVCFQLWKTTSKPKSLTAKANAMIWKKGWSELRNFSKSLKRGTTTRSSVWEGNQPRLITNIFTSLILQLYLTSPISLQITLMYAAFSPGVQTSRRSSRRTGSWRSSGIPTTSSPRRIRKKRRRGLSTSPRLKKSSLTQVRSCHMFGISRQMFREG